jgi:hypothetical protein
MKRMPRSFINQYQMMKGKGSRWNDDVQYEGERIIRGNDKGNKRKTIWQINCRVKYQTVTSSPTISKLGGQDPPDPQIHDEDLTAQHFANVQTDNASAPWISPCRPPAEESAVDDFVFNPFRLLRYKGGLWARSQGRGRTSYGYVVKRGGRRTNYLLPTIGYSVSHSSNLHTSLRCIIACIGFHSNRTGYSHFKNWWHSPEFSDVWQVN